MSYTFADLFCGAGGSINGFVDAGLELIIGANHSPRAIETVSTNHTEADFLCCDINNLDKRRLPKTDILWASVICTEMSPAGGNRKHHGQASLDLEKLGHVPSDAYERTRACALDVVQATEIHRYLAVVVENVVEFARDWELYDWWVEGMCKLGYNVQVVNASAAHVYGPNNPPAPQWRDRIFIVFTRTGVRLPNLALRPPAWCERCENLVDGLQTFKRPDRRQVGKYGQQYVYRCPVDGTVVEPLVLPAIAAIDTGDIGERIGDRRKPLAANTMARIEWGIRTLVEPVIVAAAGNTYERPGYHRAWPATQAPLNTRQATGCDAIATPAFYVKNNGDASEVSHCSYPVDSEPMSTLTAKVSQGLTSVPFIVKNYGGRSEAKYRSVPADEPLGSITTQDSHGIASVPFMVAGYSGGLGRRVKPVLDEPLGTVVANGRGHHQLVTAPFVTMLRANNRPTTMGEPLATVTTGRHHYLTTPPPFIFQNAHGGHDGRSFPVDGAPLHTVTATHGDAMVTPGAASGRHFDRNALVIPYRRKSRPKPITDPLHAVSTHQSAALLQPSLIDILDCYYRMLKPREHARAQRFYDDYIITGNIGEQTMQAGNAVPCNVAQWIGTALIECLDAA